jgi:hypothetical protein
VSEFRATKPARPDHDTDLVIGIERLTRERDAAEARVAALSMEKVEAIQALDALRGAVERLKRERDAARVFVVEARRERDDVMQAVLQILDRAMAAEARVEELEKALGVVLDSYGPGDPTEARHLGTAWRRAHDVLLAVPPGSAAEAKGGGA